MIRLLAALVLIGVSVNAQTITETFGTGANEFSIDFVTIGNPGNAADTTGTPNPAGSVNYVYNIGKYEVSRDMIDKANAAAGLGITMRDMTAYGGSGPNRPADSVWWYDAARFVNYLNISQGFSPAYRFDATGNFQLWTSASMGFDPGNPFRNLLAKFRLPTIDEWYKAAYGSPDGTWFKYPNGSDEKPLAVPGGTDPNTAVYAQPDSQGPADITNAGGLSAWGTMAQGGNVYEWTETAADGVNDDVGENRMIRGGSWGHDGNMLSHAGGSGGLGGGGFGFRVAMVPEPTSLSLLLAGGLVALARRRKP